MLLLFRIHYMLFFILFSFYSHIISISFISYFGNPSTMIMTIIKTNNQNIKGILYNHNGQKWNRIKAKISRHENQIYLDCCFLFFYFFSVFLFSLPFLTHCDFISVFTWNSDFSLILCVLFSSFTYSESRFVLGFIYFLLFYRNKERKIWDNLFSSIEWDLFLFFLLLLLLLFWYSMIYKILFSFY